MEIIVCHPNLSHRVVVKTWDTVLSTLEEGGGKRNIRIRIFLKPE